MSIAVLGYCIIAFIVIYLGFILWDIADRPRRAVQEPTWEAPNIPQCDKPLWERIKDGCG